MMIGAKAGLAVLGLLAVAGLPAQAATDGARPLGPIDANEDGFVDRGEMLAAGDRAFDRLDGDGNGVLSQDEAMTIRRRAQARAEAAAAPPASPAPPAATAAEAEDDEEEAEEPGQDRRAARRDARWFERLDRDGNGAISREEFRERRAAAFERLDRDGDGRLTPEEMPRRRGRG